MRFPQEAFIRAFQCIFPASVLGDVFSQFQWPMIEDVVNRFPFTAYAEWRETEELRTDEGLGPAHLTQQNVFAGRCTSNQQQGAFSHKTALPPVVPYQLSPDQHFAEALEIGQKPTPIEKESWVDHDLSFAAYMMLTQRQRNVAIGKGSYSDAELL